MRTGGAVDRRLVHSSSAARSRQEVSAARIRNNTSHANVHYGSSLDELFATVPVSYSRMFHTALDWELWTTPQEHSGGVAKYWPRGKLLGGCSCLNAMVLVSHHLSKICELICLSRFHMAAPEDYDEWALAQKGQEGANGWSYSEFRK